MIEAVNSVISAAPLLRGNTGQLDAARSTSQTVARVAEGPRAPFISPYIVVDTNSNAVLQIRDSETGDVVQQFPSESTLQQRQRVATARTAAEALTVQAQVRSTPGEDIASTVTVSAAPAPTTITTTTAPAPVAEAQVAAAALGASAQVTQPTTGGVSVEA